MDSKFSLPELTCWVHPLLTVQPWLGYKTPLLFSHL